MTSADPRPATQIHQIGDQPSADATAQPARPVGPKQKPGETGGPKGPEPTRYGDWEVNGRCTDF